MSGRMPERLMLGADEVTILATSAQTASALFAVEVTRTSHVVTGRVAITHLPTAHGRPEPA